MYLYTDDKLHEVQLVDINEQVKQLDKEEHDDTHVDV
jgi:hypothetical protein